MTGKEKSTGFSSFILSSSGSRISFRTNFVTGWTNRGDVKARLESASINVDGGVHCSIFLSNTLCRALFRAISITTLSTKWYQVFFSPPFAKPNWNALDSAFLAAFVIEALTRLAKESSAFSWAISCLIGRNPADARRPNVVRATRLCWLTCQ